MTGARVREPDATPRVDPKKYLGESALERMRKTKWYALARFLDALLYEGGDMYAEANAKSGYAYTGLRKAKPDDPEYTRKFVTGVRIYIGSDRIPESLQFFGRDGAYCDTAKTLRELMHECERLAMKEATE